MVGKGAWHEDREKGAGVGQENGAGMGRENGASMIQEKGAGVGQEKSWERSTCTCSGQRWDKEKCGTKNMLRV